MQDREREVLQFPFDGGHTQPVRQRRDHLEGFACLLGLLLRGQEPHGPHIVQPVGYLDHQDTRVAGHRDDHLADGLGLRRGTQVHLVQLGDTVDEMGHLGAEIRGQLFERVPGVLDGVVQQGRDQGGGVHAQLGQDVRHRQRVGDVRVTGFAELGRVPLVGHIEGPLQLGEIGLRVQLAVHRGQWLEHRFDRRDPALTGHSPGQPGAYPAGGRTRYRAGGSDTVGIGRGLRARTGRGGGGGTVRLRTGRLTDIRLAQMLSHATTSPCRGRSPQRSRPPTLTPAAPWETPAATPSTWIHIPALRVERPIAPRRSPGGAVRAHSTRPAGVSSSRRVTPISSRNR